MKLARALNIHKGSPKCIHDMYCTYYHCILTVHTCSPHNNSQCFSSTPRPPNIPTTLSSSQTPSRDWLSGITIFWGGPVSLLSAVVNRILAHTCDPSPYSIHFPMAIFISSFLPLQSAVIQHLARCVNCFGGGLCFCSPVRTQNNTPVVCVCVDVYGANVFSVCVWFLCPGSRSVPDLTALLSWTL